MIEGIILYRNGSFRTDGESYIEDGILSLENDKTRIISATDFASIDSLKVAGTTSEGKSRLAVYCDYDDISEAIRFVSDSGTSIREYKMFGEHNTDLLSPVIQNLLTGGEISMIKSVQRGFKYTTAGTSSVTVEINAVDISKSDISVEGSTFGNSGAYSGVAVFVKEVTDTSFTVVPVDYQGTDTIFKFGWQVIEYY